MVFNNQTTKKPYTEQRAFNAAVSNVVNKYTKSKMGSTLLRIAYATNILFAKNGKPPSLSVQNNHAVKLGHSLATFQTYARYL